MCGWILLSFMALASFFSRIKHVCFFSADSFRVRPALRKKYICAETLCVKRTSCYKPANKLQDACSQAVDMMCSHCLFSGVETSLEQAVNDL